MVFTRHSGGKICQFVFKILYCIIILIQYGLRYFATFKVRKCESLFYKINTFLLKTTIFIELQVEQTFSANM